MVFDEAAPLHRSACRCASTNQSHLSTPRETSVKRSAVSASESSLERSISARTSLPNALRTAESASTCSRPSPRLTGYSGSDEGRAVGDTAELYRALGDQVDVLLDGVVHLVEQLVQRDEVGTLDVPVG